MIDKLIQEIESASDQVVRIQTATELYESLTGMLSSRDITVWNRPQIFDREWLNSDGKPVIRGRRNEKFETQFFRLSVQNQDDYLKRAQGVLEEVFVDAEKSTFDRNDLWRLIRDYNPVKIVDRHTIFIAEEHPQDYFSHPTSVLRYVLNSYEGAKPNGFTAIMKDGEVIIRIGGGFSAVFGYTGEQVPSRMSVYEGRVTDDNVLFNVARTGLIICGTAGLNAQLKREMNEYSQRDGRPDYHFESLKKTKKIKQ